MEEVVRKLFQEHHFKLQRQRIEKVIDGQKHNRLSRKIYDFRDRTPLATPETNFSIDEQIRFQKQFYQTRRPYRARMLESHCKRFELPSIEPPAPKKILKRKLKAAFLAVLFTQRLKSTVKTAMLKRKTKSQKHSSLFVRTADKLVHHYYQHLLQQELIQYVALLQKNIDNKNINQDKESLQILYYIAQKLAQSSATKDLIAFFHHTATDKAFPPSDFLSAAEINRLDFSPNYGCLINVTHEQTRMLIGLGLGIKIFCFYILYQPWKLEFAGQQLISNYQQVKQTINNIGSIFYFILLEYFCLSLPEVRTVGKSLIADFGVKPIQTLNPFHQPLSNPTSKFIIAGQSRQFYNTMSLKYPNLIKSIKQNLYIWISRISYACLKQHQSTLKSKKQSNTFFKTIDNNNQPLIETSKRFRSIELPRKKEYSHQKYKEKYWELPSLKMK